MLVRHTYGDRRWMLPGGRLRRGEQCVDRAMREMRDELGVTGTGWREIGQLRARREYRRRSPTEEFRRHATHYLEAEVESPQLRPRSAELADAGWFTVDHLPDDRSDALDFALRNGWLR